MLTFSSLGGQTIRIEWDKKSVVVFPSRKDNVEATVILYANPDEEPVAGTISWPGEYDVQEMAIRGIGHEDGGVVSYAIELDGVRCAFLCTPLHEWTDHELQLLGNVDVLVIPADEPKIVQKLIDEVDPRVLIPIIGTDEAHYPEVLKICGAQGHEPVSEYKIKVLNAEGREVVVLSS
ncbi:MAG: MBL fold metallo-hydrolase [bacterium]|nr:MBL fold metallo-hydrolase [bacterium]